MKIIFIIVVAYAMLQPIVMSAQWNTSSCIVQLNNSNQTSPVAITDVQQAVNRGKLFVEGNPDNHANDWLVYLHANQPYTSDGVRGAILTLQGDEFGDADPILMQGLPNSSALGASFQFTHDGVGRFKSYLDVHYYSPSTGKVLVVGGDEALWYNDTYFSWGYGGAWNRFADPLTFGSNTAPASGVAHRIDNSKDLNMVGGDISFIGAGDIDFNNTTGNAINFRNSGGIIISQLSAGQNFFKVSNLARLLFEAGNINLLDLVGQTQTVKYGGHVNFSESHSLFWGSDHSNPDISFKRVGDDLQLTNHTTIGKISIETQGSDVSITNTEAQVLLHNDNVGINISNPLHTLHVSGDVGITGEFYALSDERVKEHIKELDGGLGMINELHPVMYTYKTDIEGLDLSANLQYGLIAQEVKEVLPDLITAHTTVSLEGQVEPEELLGVNYTAIIPILIQAIQEQDVIMRQQDTDIAELKEKVEYLMEQTKKN